MTFGQKLSAIVITVAVVTATGIAAAAPAGAAQAAGVARAVRAGAVPAAPAAGAASAAGPTAGRITRAAKATDASGTVTLSAGGIEILCRVAIDQPVYIPQLGAVTGSARVLCNFVIPKIVLYVELTRDNVELPGSTSQAIEQDTLSAGATAAAPCVSGFYFASALVFVTFPLGVVPPNASALYDGGGISIQC